jgi:PAS domain S-box-containing protein
VVTAVTRVSGVRRGPVGKVVWVSVGDEAGARTRGQEWALEPGPPTLEREENGDAGHAVVLRGFPPGLWFAARAHHDAMLREFALHLVEHGDTLPSVPDVAHADEARTLLWRSLSDELDRRGAPRPPALLSELPQALDLRLEVPRRLAAGFAALQDALDLAEQLAVADRLLVRPGLPEIIAVRDWVCEQVVAQLADVPASPWAGATDDRFVHVVHDREDADLGPGEIAQVRQSARSLVAADEANRIVAISTPLASVLGWEPDELVGRRVVTLVPPALREAHVAGFSRHVTTGETRILGSELDLPVLHRDGRELRCRLRVECVETGRGRLYIAEIDPLVD